MYGKERCGPIGDLSMPPSIPEFAAVIDSPNLPEVRRTFAEGSKRMLEEHPELGAAPMDHLMLSSAQGDDVSMELRKKRIESQFGGVHCVLTQIIPKHLVPEEMRQQGLLGADYPLTVKLTEEILMPVSTEIKILAIQWGFAQRYAELESSFQESLDMAGKGNILKIQMWMEKLEQRYEEVIRAVRSRSAA